MNRSLCWLALLAMNAPLAADEIELVLVHEVDISHLELGQAGDLCFDPPSDSVWIGDGCGFCNGVGTDTVVRVDPRTGVELSSFQIESSFACHGLARSPFTGDLYAFEPSFGPQAVIVDTAGNLLGTLAEHHNAWSATFTRSGELWVSSIHAPHVRRIDATSGALLEGFSVPGITSAFHALAHDPRTDLLVGMQQNHALVIDPVLGVVLDSFLVPGSELYLPGPALTFDEDGEHAFFAQLSWDAETSETPQNHVLYTFERVLPATPLCFGEICPCGNPGGAREGCANSTGLGARLLDAGTASVTDDDLSFMGVGLVPGQPALLFCGDATAGGGSGVSFGDGLRCADGAVRRLVTKTPDVVGRAKFGPRLADPGGWSAGDLRYFQAYYRDPVGGPCGAGFNTTHAMSVSFEP